MVLPTAIRQSGYLDVMPRWRRLRAWPGLLLLILAGLPARLGAAPFPGAYSSLTSGSGTRSVGIGEPNGGGAPARAKATDGSPVTTPTCWLHSSSEPTPGP
jgi:hypothetical protein